MALDTNILANGVMSGGNPFRNALAAQSIRQNDQAMRINQQESENRNKLFERQAVLDQKQQTQADEAAGREKALMQAQFIAKAVPELKKYATTAERASAVQGMSQMAAQMGIPLDKLTPDHLTDQQLDMTLSQIVPFIEQMSQIKQVSQPVTIINPETGVPEVVIPVTDDKGVTRNNLIGRSNAQTPQEKADLADAQMRARLYEEQRLRQSDPLYQSQLETQKVNQALKQNELNDVQVSKEAGVQAANEQIRIIDQLINHPGRQRATGFSSILPTVPGGSAADYETKLSQLDATNFMNVIQQMRGLGQLSNAEGQTAKQAMSDVNLSQSEEEHVKSLKVLKRIIEQGIKRKIGTYEAEKSPQGTQRQDGVIPKPAYVYDPATGTMVKQ